MDLDVVSKINQVKIFQNLAVLRIANCWESVESCVSSEQSNVENCVHSQFRTI